MKAVTSGKSGAGTQPVPYDPAVATPGVGDQAPDFELPGTGGRSYTLSSYRGHPVLLVFYPGDDTPG